MLVKIYKTDHSPIYSEKFGKLTVMIESYHLQFIMVSSKFSKILKLFFKNDKEIICGRVLFK